MAVYSRSEDVYLLDLVAPPQAFSSAESINGFD